MVDAGDIWTAALKELAEADTVRSVLCTGESSSMIGAALGVEIVLALPAVEVVGMDFATDPWSPTEDRSVSPTSLPKKQEGPSMFCC